MKRQAAFIEEGPFLKGGLHCHTTRSDGAGEPGDVIRLHVRNGYDFLALTDHRRYNYQNFSDEDIIIVPGMEMDANFPGPGVHCIHTVCLGPSKEDGNGFEQDQRFESGSIQDQLDYQPTLDWIHANQNMTIYCHPQWSSTPARDFDKLQGYFAMEVWNTGCVMENEMDTNAAYWDELLMQGKQIFGVAVDDGHAMNQHCGGWVMVKAEKKLSSILDALKNGRFYASTGPEIKDFYVTDEGVAVVDCAPCQAIQFLYGRYPTRIIRNQDGLITHGEFKLPGRFLYIRASVIDEKGRRAWTNPIFL